MWRACSAPKRFSKKLSDQRWSSTDLILEHKAEKAGVPYVMVNPAYTSTDCSQCGHRQPMPLEVRGYECPSLWSGDGQGCERRHKHQRPRAPMSSGREGLLPGAAALYKFRM